MSPVRVYLQYRFLYNETHSIQIFTPLCLHNRQCSLFSIKTTCCTRKAGIYVFVSSLSKSQRLSNFYSPMHIDLNLYFPNLQKNVDQLYENLALGRGDNEYWIFFLEFDLNLYYTVFHEFNRRESGLLLNKKWKLS